MPTYQYACTACGEQLERVQAFTDAPLTECPACGGRLRKVFSAVGVVFKGSGFYKTDSRSSGAKATGESKGDGGGAGDGKGGGTGDGASSKPATPAATGSAGKGDGGGSSTPVAKTA